MPLGCLAALFGIKEKAPPPAAPTPSIPTPSQDTNRQVPAHLPVTTKRYFFSPDENTFFRALEQTLAGTSYRVFPNVRLGDVFRITDKAQYASVRGRLKDKHVDFLIVDASKDFQPVLAIELDGKSHERENQQYNDAVKDIVFASAGLPLVRLPSRPYTAEEIGAQVKARLQPQ